jgi:hypothetical protein
MKFYVTTHRPLEWPLPGFMEAISTVPAGEGVADLSVQHPHLAGRGPQLSEYATLFALRRQLQSSWRDSGAPADDEMIGLAHYRRFAVTRPIGTSAGMYGMITSEELAGLPEDVLVPPAETLLLPSTFVGITVLQQYGRSHPLRDLLHFMALAVDLGIVDGRRAGGFLSQQVMVAAPTVGVFPIAWLVDVLEKLEKVVEAFESSVAVAHEGYQRRAVGFCCERLHAMLLHQLVAEWAQDRVIVNRAVVVSDDGTYLPTV